MNRLRLLLSAELCLIAGEIDLTEDQQKKVRELLESYKGKPVPDKPVHDLADEFGIETDLLESYIYGIAAQYLLFEDAKVNPGGRAEEKGVTEKDFPKATIDKGIKVELEHTDDRELAKKIVLDHLAEFPDYYEALDKMEKDLEKKGSVVDALERLSSEMRLAAEPSYKEYVQDKRKKGEKPLSKDEWEAKVLGKGKKDTGTYPKELGFLSGASGNAVRKNLGDFANEIEDYQERHPDPSEGGQEKLDEMMEVMDLGQNISTFMEDGKPFPKWVMEDYKKLNSDQQKKLKGLFS